MDSIQNYSLKIGEHQVELETGRLAKSAGGAVTVKCGDNVILVSATGTEDPRPGIDFFPLLVDYEEKMSSIGKIPGSFMRKEGRPSDKAILISRLIDRPVRPLFPKGYRNDVQIVASTLSSDQELQPDTFAIFGASVALGLAGLPFEGPIGAVRVSELDGKFVINPTYNQSNESDLDIVIAGTEDSVIMVEAGCNFVPESKILQAVEVAMEEIKKQVQAQKEFFAQCGVVKKEYINPYDTTELKKLTSETCRDNVYKAYHQFDRATRKELINAAKAALKEKVKALPEDHSIKVLLAESGLDFVSEEFKSLEKEIMREMIIKEGVRADGRKADEIRPITCEVGMLPRVHGSAVFTRGSTQVLSSATLAGPGLAQELEGVDPQTEKRYMHNYAFPAFSVGEVRPSRGPGRREIGHGALAERAIIPALPPKEEFVYAIRVNSDVLESNGSTSMASTCASCLALMDAGVPMKTVIAGVAMGLIKEKDKTVVLTDIQGIEDFLGDMDFKVTGDQNGITALQMDIKIKGLDTSTLKEAIDEAKKGRLHILDKMVQTMPEPRAELSEWAPRLQTLKIDPDTIGALIGPGGKTIKGIIEQTGATIDIEDDGTVHVGCSEAEGMKKALQMVKQLTLKLETGMILAGKVVRTLPIGAFVEVAPGKDGLVHISKLAQRRINTVDEVVSLGDQVVVKVLGIDEKGRVNLSMRDVTDQEREAALASK
ncbi:MAG TPA: polyribonucleotide nucleotidyltransferase [Candidatus Gastranaerophilales bacterium]|nr:polyribonucleotide nucleotidyltransferase [Candidatus Gastranaerophilales bacterium]